jgi:hypothetical protein
MGDDLRQLAYDHAPSDKMYDIDIVNHWDVGFNMYREEGRFKAEFIEADIMDIDTNPQLAALAGKIDIISISAVLHQWQWDAHLECAKQLVTFQSLRRSFRPSDGQCESRTCVFCQARYNAVEAESRVVQEAVGSGGRGDRDSLGYGSTIV